MSLMFTDPIAQVVITDIETGEEWHWGSPTHPFLSGVTITFENQMAMNQMLVSVEIPYEYALRYLDTDSTPFKKDNLIKARILYASGGGLPWCYGFLMTSGQGLSITPDGLTGPLQITFDSVKISGYSMSKDVLKAAGFDAEKLINSIGEMLGSRVQITSGAKANLSAWKDARLLPISYSKGPDVFGGLESMDTWSALKRVCADSDVQYHVSYVGGQKCLFVYTEKEKLDGNLSDARINKYVLRGILDPERRQYPCYNFAPAEDEVAWIANARTASASGVNAAGIDTDKGEDVTKDIQPQDSEEPLVGYLDETVPAELRVSDSAIGEAVKDAQKMDGTLGTFMSGPVLPGGIGIFQNQARKFQRQGNPGLKMEIDTIGLDTEHVGNLCELWGCGVLYNATYYIDKLVHSWSPGTWDMRISAFRQGWKSVFGKKEQTAGGQMQTS